MDAISAGIPRDGNWLTMEMNGLYHVGTLVPFAKEAESLAKHGGGAIAERDGSASLSRRRPG